jgi:hypothetical protein
VKSMDLKHSVLDATQLPSLGEQADRIAAEVWPEFMLHDPVASKYWQYLYRDWPEYQFALVERGTVLAVGNSVPVCWNGPLADLPEEGWDWILPKAVDDRANGCRPNTQAAIQVMVSRNFQGRGLSAEAVVAMTRIGSVRGHERLIVPTRPTKKSEYPGVLMEEYMTWRDPQDHAFDPWLRVHTRLGGRIVKVCHNSMRIPGSLAEWHQWTGVQFRENGPCTVPGALCPVKVDLQGGIAEYVEPNVWMVHNLQRVSSSTVESPSQGSPTLTT